MNNYIINIENIDKIDDRFEAYGHIVPARKIISEVCSERRSFIEARNYIDKICKRFSVDRSHFKLVEISDN